jgi:hypothetical protein
LDLPDSFFCVSPNQLHPEQTRPRPSAISFITNSIVIRKLVDKDTQVRILAEVKKITRKSNLTGHTEQIGRCPRKNYSPEQIERATTHSTNAAFERYLQVTGEELREMYAETGAGAVVGQFSKRASNSK